jgi:glycosyltransferase involved in cell wall biosynthesis
VPAVRIPAGRILPGRVPTRIILVTDELPRPGIAGHLSYNHALLAWAVDAGHEVSILLTGPRLPGFAVRPTVPVYGPHAWLFAGLLWPRTPRALVRLLARATIRRWRAAGAVLGAFPTTADAAWCAAHLARARPDMVLIDTIFRSPLAPAAPPSVLIAHDLFHRRAAAFAAAGLAPTPAITAAQEAALAARCTLIAAIQPEEAALFRSLCPGRAVITLPMPALPCPPPAGRPAGRRLAYLGSAAPANIAGLRWFLAEVWPHLHDITLDIIGDAGPALCSTLGVLPAGVTAHGRRRDIASVLHGADLAIAPLTFGSGLKIKLLDYARHGLTTVATGPAVAGFAPGGPFIVADDAAGFTAAITAALEAPRRTIAALTYVAAHYAPAACFAPLGEAIGRLVAV